MKWNYLDMFSGIGGFRLGLEWAGFEFGKTFHSDIDKHANKIYSLRNKKSEALGDITTVDPEKLEKIDIITAGFPCQDLSSAGRQAGIHGKKSGLFGEIIRVCRICRPRYVILENVANLINRPDWFGYVLGCINGIGYDAEWKVISAAEFGALHLRRRVWILAYPRSDGRAILQQTKESDKFKRKIREFNEGRPTWKCAISRLRPVDKWKAIESFHSGGYDGVSPWMDRLKCLGNTIFPQTAEFLGRQILKAA